MCARSWQRAGGLLRINQRVVGALRASLAEQGCALLDTLDTQERGLSPLIVQLGRLLNSTGRAGVARALFEEAHASAARHSAGGTRTRGWRLTTWSSCAASRATSPPRVGCTSG